MFPIQAYFLITHCSAWLRETLSTQMIHSDWHVFCFFFVLPPLPLTPSWQKNIVHRDLKLGNMVLNKRYDTTLLSHTHIQPWWRRGPPTVLSLRGQVSGSGLVVGVKFDCESAAEDTSSDQTVDGELIFDWFLNWSRFEMMMMMVVHSSTVGSMVQSRSGLRGKMLEFCFCWNVYDRWRWGMFKTRSLSHSELLVTVVLGFGHSRGSPTSLKTERYFECTWYYKQLLVWCSKTSACSISFWGRHSPHQRHFTRLKIIADRTVAEPIPILLLTSFIF